MPAMTCKRSACEREPSPDVIVSDFQLNATLNGAELIEELRKLRRVFHKPVDAEELSVHIRKVLDGVAA